jgi:hypothetical protein
MTTLTLEEVCLRSLQDQLDSKQITLKILERNLNSVVYNKLLEILIEKSRTKYMQSTFKFLKGELLVKTAHNISVDEDMQLLYDPETDEVDREYVRNIYIDHKYSGDINMGNYIEETDEIELREYMDDDWKYVFPFVTEFIYD